MHTLCSRLSGTLLKAKSCQRWVHIQRSLQNAAVLHQQMPEAHHGYSLARGV